MSLFKTILLSLLTITPLVMSVSEAQAEDAGNIYPRGSKMLLGLYDSQTGIETKQREGWNLSQSYSRNRWFLQDTARARQPIMRIFDIPGSIGYRNLTSVSNIRRQMDAISKYNVYAWEFPEELYHTRELPIARQFKDTLRKYDRKRLPHYMYLPSHLRENVLQQAVKNIDIIGLSVYRYGFRPPGWIRWRMETLLEGIKKNGNSVGRNYLANQKTPIAVLEMFKSSTNPGPISYKDAVHDFWQSLVSGAKGVMIFSHRRIRDDRRLETTFRGYKDAMQKLTRNNLDDVLLWGRKVNRAKMSVASGPSMTPYFSKYWKGRPQKTRVPTVNMKEYEYSGYRYIFLVNSHPSSRIVVRLTGVQNRTRLADLPLTGAKHRISGTSLNRQLDPLETVVLKVRM